MAAYISFQPSDFFKVLKYSYASPPNAITGVGFEPDALVIKSISGTSGGNNWYIGNTVTGSGESLRWNSNAGQQTSSDSVTSYDSDGFTLGADSGTGNVNMTGTNYVSYSWKAGTTSGIAGSPSITPTGYSFDQTAGISVIQYEGTGSAATIPHGLGVKPDMAIIKNLDATQNWGVYNSGMVSNPWTKAIRINLDSAGITSSGMWNDTEPTTELFTVGTETIVNGSGNTQVAWFFANKKGFSKIGAYDGNGNADGPYIFTGFRPAFLILKNWDGSNNWTAFDSQRDLNGNPTDMAVNPNSSSAEFSETDGVDLLSNGFKIRESASWCNGSGESIMYAAFAEFPLVSSNSKAGVAR